MRDLGQSCVHLLDEAKLEMALRASLKVERRMGGCVCEVEEEDGECVDGGK